MKASFENPFYSIHTRSTLDSLTKPPILAHERTLWLLLRHCGLPIWIFTTRYGSKSVCLFTSVEHGLRFYSLVIDSPYLGQIAPVAVFTAREGARGVYAGVFGRAVLTTLSIGLPRPFLLRAADIGPTVKTHCLFPPPLREPDGHATYTETRGDHGEMVRRLIRRAVITIRLANASTPEISLLWLRSLVVQFPDSGSWSGNSLPVRALHTNAPLIRLGETLISDLNFISCANKKAVVTAILFSLLSQCLLINLINS